MYATPRPDGRSRPVLDLEQHYENAHHWFISDQPYWTASDIRRGGWQAIVAGACGYTYGCNSAWQMNNALSPQYAPVDIGSLSGTVGKENWFEELDLPSAFQAGIMRQICLALPNYSTREPDSSFILSDRHEPSDGSRAGDRLIQGMRGDGWATVHLPFGGEVELDWQEALSLREAGWKVWWIDPRTGGRELISSNRSRETRAIFTSPTADGVAADWLLFVETVSGSDAWFQKAI